MDGSGCHKKRIATEEGKCLRAWREMWQMVVRGTLAICGFHRLQQIEDAIQGEKKVTSNNI